MKRRLKKVIVSMLSFLLVICIGLETQAAGNSVSAEYDIYEANVIINSLDGNSLNSWYSLFDNFQKPLYYELTDYLLENKVLTWESNFWNSAFNDDFRDNPSYFYEVIIMGFLKYEQNQRSTIDIIESKEKMLAVTLYSELSDYYVDIETKDLIENLKNMTVGEAIDKFKAISNVSGISETLVHVESFCSTGEEVLEAVAEYRALQEAKEERIAILKYARQSVTDNAYFTKAVDDVIEKLEKTQISYVLDSTMEYLWDDFLDTAWELIVEGSPIGTILKSINIEKQILDVLFNTSDTASNNFKLLVVYIVDTYFYNAMKSAKTAFEISQTEENARTFTACYRAYAEYQMYGLDYTKTFMKDIVDSGPLHNIVEQIFFRESINNAQELGDHCNHQISIRLQLLDLLDKLPSIFYKQNNLTDIVQEVANVPVTSIAFKESEIILDHKDDIFVVCADVFPKDSTNQTVTYISSDPSILEVPEKGGFVTLKKEGTVTITATAEDGGYSAIQTVTVGEGESLSMVTGGKCGENVDWGLYNDGTLYINGTGNMKDYCFQYYTNGVVFGSTAPWYGYYTTGRIKYLKVQSGVTSLGDYAFLGCQNMEKVDMPDSITSIGTRTFMECSSLKEIEISSCVTSIGRFAFSECQNLEKINIPDGVNRIEEETFNNCTSLSKIEIPNSVKNIDTSAFSYCYGLEEVSISNSVTDIGVYAFYWCYNLKKVEIPKSAISIGKYAFSGCDNLESFTILSENCKMTDEYGSYNSGILPNNTIIHGYLGSTAEKYAKAHNMTFVALVQNGDNGSNTENYHSLIPAAGDKITDIKTKAIYKVITPNSSVIYTGSTDDNATSINIPSMVVINNITYKVESIANGTFKNNKKVKFITISGNVTSIGNSAFEGCTSLIKCTIPSSVKKIGKKAFYNCKKLRILNIKTKNLTSKSIGSKAFSKAGSSNYKKLKIKVPKQKYKSYKKILKSTGLSSKVIIKR